MTFRYGLARRRHRCDAALEEIVQGESSDRGCRGMVVARPDPGLWPSSWFCVLVGAGLFDSPMRFRQPLGEYYTCMTQGEPRPDEGGQ